MTVEEMKELVEQIKEAYAKGWSDALESVKAYCQEQNQK